MDLSRPLECRGEQVLHYAGERLSTNLGKNQGVVEEGASLSLAPLFGLFDLVPGRSSQSRPDGLPLPGL